MSADRELQALLREAHQQETGRGFAASWRAASLASASPPPQRLFHRLSLAAAMLLIAGSAWLALQPAAPTPGELASLGDLHGPTDFLLARPRHHSPTAFLMSSPAESLLSGVPALVSPPSSHP